MKIKTNPHGNKKKTTKRPHIESSSDNESEHEHHQFIVLESIENTPLTKISPFKIEKIISTNIQKPESVKKMEQY